MSKPSNSWAIMRPTGGCSCGRCARPGRHDRKQTMKSYRAVLIGLLAVLVAGPCLAQTASLEFPLDRQVFQRTAAEQGEVQIAGTVPTNATLVEVKAELAAGLRGKAVAWTLVAQGEQIKDGRFSKHGIYHAVFAEMLQETFGCFERSTERSDIFSKKENG